MGKTFNEVFEEIREGISTSKSGSPVKSFNRADFDKLTKAYLNTPDYAIESVAQRNGELVTKEIESVKMFRGMIQRILRDFGVDKQEAESILDNYEFKNVDGIYELVSELIYQYMNVGKKFNFITRDDFMGSLTLREIDEHVSEHRAPGSDEKFKVKKKSHKILEKKSKTPDWLKERL